MQQKGLTFMEVLVALAIILALTAFAAPAFERVWQKTKDSALSDELMNAILLARNEAVTRGEMITICKSRDQKTCSGDWEDGFIIYSPEKLLHSFHSGLDRGTLHWRAFPRGQDNLQFLSQGTSRFENGTFWYCIRDEKKPRWAIMVSQSGRARKVSPDQLSDHENIHC